MPEGQAGALRVERSVKDREETHAGVPELQDEAVKNHDVLDFKGRLDWKSVSPLKFEASSSKELARLLGCGTMNEGMSVVLERHEALRKVLPDWTYLL